MLNLQPKNLQTELITLIPLKESDFESVFAVASDPLIWEQHPDRERFKKEVFQLYFDSAIESKGAFKVCHAITSEVIGCSRYYHLNETDKTVMVGYTFLARKYWGGLYNSHLKKLMFTHAFNHNYTVHLQIGSTNFRSQKATEKLGAKKIKEELLDFPKQTLHFVYKIARENFKVI